MNSNSEAGSRPALRTLTALEARVLGVLLEKERTVPDTYPLSLNALTSGCNQKTARVPVINASEADVQEALDSLKYLSLVFDASSSRVPRYEHNMLRALAIPSQAAALLTTLILRGPQTAAELRLNSARLHGFADVSSVEAFLDELSESTPPRVVKLARAPGSRESRWAHLLCGEVAAAEVSRGTTADGDGPDTSEMTAEMESLKAEQQRLADEVARLKAIVEHLAGQLGVSINEIGGAH
ncbi:MAG TPA: YceH family protein [Pararobbsia sp.]|nr:YceH family protein [Pararobbsia sp.]